MNQRNYRILPTDALGVGSLKQKFRENVAAIETLQRLEGEGREATEEEKQVLVRYVGWGGLPQAFAWQQDSADWDAERETLKNLLSKEEYEAAQTDRGRA